MTAAIKRFARRLMGRGSIKPKRGSDVPSDRGETTSFVRVGDIPFRLDGDFLVSTRLEVVNGASLTVHIERLPDCAIPALPAGVEDDRQRLLRLARSVRIRLSVA